MCGFFLLPHVEVNIMDRVWILLLATGHTTLYPNCGLLLVVVSIHQLSSRWFFGKQQHI